MCGSLCVQRDWSECVSRANARSVNTAFTPPVGGVGREAGGGGGVLIAPSATAAALGGRAWSK